MKIQTILKSAIDIKRINNLKSKISQNERCLNKAKAKREKALIWDCVNDQRIYYEIPSRII